MTKEKHIVKLVGGNGATVEQQKLIGMNGEQNHYTIKVNGAKLTLPQSEMSHLQQVALPIVSHIPRGGIVRGGAKVRITKCSNPMYWYSSIINDELELLEEYDYLDGRLIRVRYNGAVKSVHPADCEVIWEGEGKAWF